MSHPGVTVTRAMVGVAWTAIALLAGTLLGSLYYLGSKIDALGARLDARIDAQAVRIDALVREVADLRSQLHDHMGRPAG
jgi:hypothetical protein